MNAQREGVGGSAVQDAVLKELRVRCSRPPVLANSGFEAHTWLLDLDEPFGGETQLALRLYASSRREGAQAREAAVLRHVATSDCPAPRAVAHGDSFSAFGVPWLLMTKVDGRPIRSMQTLARAAAAVHGVPVEGWSIAPAQAVQGDAAATLQSNPRLAEAASRLSTMPLPASPIEPSIVHGDFGASNVLGDDAGVFTVVDWGAASPGDRHQDLGYVVAALRYADDAEAERTFLDAYPLAIDDQLLRLRIAIALVGFWGFAAAANQPGLAEHAGVKPEILSHAPDEERVAQLFWGALER